MSQSPKPSRIAVVASGWHKETVSQAVESFNAAIMAAGHARPDVIDCWTDAGPTVDRRASALRRAHATPLP